MARRSTITACRNWSWPPREAIPTAASSKASSRSVKRSACPVQTERRGHSLECRSDCFGAIAPHIRGWDADWLLHPDAGVFGSRTGVKTFARDGGSGNCSANRSAFRSAVNVLRSWSSAIARLPCAVAAYDLDGPARSRLLPSPRTCVEWDARFMVDWGR